MIVKFSPLAQQEFLIAAEKYEPQSPHLTNQFIDETEAFTWRIKSNPYRRPEDKHGSRRQNLKKFPYALIYILRPRNSTPTTLWIVAIAPHRKKPYYWKDRLDHISD